MDAIQRARGMPHGVTLGGIPNRSGGDGSCDGELPEGVRSHADLRGDKVLTTSMVFR